MAARRKGSGDQQAGLCDWRPQRRQLEASIEAASLCSSIPEVLSSLPTLSPPRQNQRAHWLWPNRGLSAPLFNLLQTLSLWYLFASVRSGNTVYCSYLDATPTLTAEAFDNPRIPTGPPEFLLGRKISTPTSPAHSLGEM